MLRMRTVCSWMEICFVKLGRSEEAITVYTKILAIDPMNRSALTSSGLCISAMRDTTRKPRNIFNDWRRLIQLCMCPILRWVTCTHRGETFRKLKPLTARVMNWRRAIALIVAGGINAAIETHHLPAAARVDEPRHEGNAARTSV